MVLESTKLESGQDGGQQEDGLLGGSKPTGFQDIDWVAKGKISPIKNQGSCGSCWAFSAIGALENLAKKKGRSDILSEQQLVDCAKGYYFRNYGCRGGWPHRALYYTYYYGSTSESSYPYRGNDGSCRKRYGSFRISKIYYAAGCTNLAKALRYGALTVAVAASGWQFYGRNTGIIHRCGYRVNHAVLLVGVDKQAWKIKNSWGTRWGNNGYIRLALGNTCNICRYRGHLPM